MKSSNEYHRKSLDQASPSLCISACGVGGGLGAWRYLFIAYMLDFELDGVGGFKSCVLLGFWLVAVWEAGLFFSTRALTARHWWEKGILLNRFFGIARPPADVDR